MEVSKKNQSPAPAAEDANPAGTQEKKWTEWSVVSTSDGTLRCRRTNVADDSDVEYRQVPQPTFSPEEIAGMIGFGGLGLLEPGRIAGLCYDRRHRTLAFRLCAELNADIPPDGAGK